jgi:hypothetical protein
MICIKSFFLSGKSIVKTANIKMGIPKKEGIKEVTDSLPERKETETPHRIKKAP